MLINSQACQIMFLAPVLLSSFLPFPLVVHDCAWWSCCGCGLGCLVPWLPGTGDLVVPQGLVLRLTVGIAIAEPQGSAAVAGLLSENLHWKSHLPTTTSASGPFHLYFAQSVPYVQRGDTEKIGKQCFSSKLVKTGDCNSLCLELFNKM